jgi:hypothetical protein
MTINIKEHLLEEGIVDHLKNHKGKYFAGLAGAGLLKAGAEGYLGVEAQDSIQNFAGEAAGKLENDAVYNDTNSNIKAMTQVFSKPDNLLSNWDENANTLKIQKAINPQYWKSLGEDTLAKGIRGVSNMDQQPDTTNFVVRNPLTAGKLAIGNVTSHVKPFIGQ